MKTKTLGIMQQDGTLSEIKRMAAGSVLATKKRNGHRNLPLAAKHLQRTYQDMPWDEAIHYVTAVTNEADDREWKG